MKLIFALLLAASAQAAPYRWNAASALRELLGPMFPQSVPMGALPHNVGGGGGGSFTFLAAAVPAFSSTNCAASHDCTTQAFGAGSGGSGNLIVAVFGSVSIPSGGEPVTDSINGGTGWSTPQCSAAIGSGNRICEAHCLNCGANSSQTVTVATTATGNPTSMICMLFSGASSGSLFDSTITYLSNAITNSSIPVPSGGGTVTPGVSNELLVSAGMVVAAGNPIGSQSVGGWSTQTGYNFVGTTGSNSAGMVYQIQTSPAATSANWPETAGGSYYFGNLFAFKP